jgi:FkbM family methyltransferase
MRFIHWIVQSLLGSPKFPGRDFFIEKLPQWFLKKPSGSTVIKTRFGFKIKIDPTFDKNIENVIYERGVYELGTVSVLQKFLKEGNTFIDVGANIGFLSLAGAAVVGKEGKVIAFEPQPETFQLLEENVKMNSFSQIQLNQFALGEEEGEAIIYSEEENRGGASITNKRSEKGVSIQLNRLDDIELGSKVDMIKIDVEGFEWEVLKGARQTILRDKPILIVEYSSDRENSGNSTDMYRWIMDLGNPRILSS